ncbi:MAG: hypothetical protein R3263_12090 [Myxococcota bacterium]|nr:hypothetical protein [Myxococcota bacterium]
MGLSWLQWVGIVGVAGLVVGWLATSLLAPGPARSRAAWVATLCMYLAFLALFTGLFLRAHEADSLVGRIGFGFLVAFFASGGALALVRTVRALAGRERAGSDHAAH